VDLPGAEVIRVGGNFKLSLAEVGFPFLLAVIEDMGPLTANSQGALEHEGARFVAEELKKKGYATIGTSSTAPSRVDSPATTWSIRPSRTGSGW
jgi:hypothetical protein